MGEEKSNRGRKRKEICMEKLADYCEFQCTKAELAAKFEVSEDTLERAIKRETGLTFGEFHERHALKGHVSLRRAMWQTARGESKSAAVVQMYLDRKHLGGLPNENNATNIAVNVVQPQISETKTIELIEQALNLPPGEKND